MNYYESLRSLEVDDRFYLDPDERADLEAFAYNIGYAPGDIIDVKLLRAWADKKIAEEQT